MKYFALNGSPRKNWNDAQLLEKFVEGIHSVDPEAEVQTIHVYDYNFTGCRSCFGCKLKTGTPLKCVVKDDIHDLLDEIRHSDGFVLASPIYFIDISGQLRCFMERLMYPGPTPTELPVSCIYTMNADKEAMEKIIRPVLTIFKNYLKQNFKTDADEVFGFDTLQRNNNELYRPGHTDMEAKARRRETQWPIDCKSAFDAGVRFAHKAQEVKARDGQNT